MLKSLKKIVIVLGILIISLTIIVILTLFNRINNVSILKKEDNYIENINIGDKFVIEDFSVDDGKIYFYLSSDDQMIIRVYKINNGNLVKEYYLN
tara:strand:- start:832 stop:1116 length:285 start_codon:yes stop_codon:yes gene_type:complete